MTKDRDPASLSFYNENYAIIVMGKVRKYEHAEDIVKRKPSLFFKVSCFKQKGGCKFAPCNECLPCVRSIDIT